MIRKQLKKPMMFRAVLVSALGSSIISKTNMILNYFVLGLGLEMKIVNV